MTRQELDVQVRNGGLIRVWYGIYAAAQPDLLGRLQALDVFMGRPAVACMGTAAALYGFDTETTLRVHVLDPGRRMRPTRGLMVHQRIGAPLRRVEGRLATAPAWTAIEVARALRRPRALATLDAALHVGACTAGELHAVIDEQKGRRGIVKVRELIGYADGRAESRWRVRRDWCLSTADYPCRSCSTALWTTTADSGVWTSPGPKRWSSPNTTVSNGTWAVMPCCMTG
ncbi:hypothetical protein I552_8596 [Mycobacterium xenopi 3993]|nr:hypothetical protein I552_8596 [Mycobacterium xenopi 3993]